ncbi:MULTISPECIES: PadR family transcriptional regulator [Pseudonocardia]|uniref:Transcriptional regulator PadR-like family protein n=2 Tax=Pseudonocardia TaxID=1847 RepID=A0A1Y2MSN8_PSEAH|nr:MULTISPECIES: PadR family transcriptional regulator [Pseudonocardia]OSY38234.1 Transcriptional regulator PadR-like family protein [Pseudonocardia autotrophica]TDN71040.1 PadR family transcriptional regulator [Pseudonocardia autotrophica]BBG01709.1 PadR family transcriptional regulator [Pseudonocardia autotrophica]GEC27416.1 PadR family transcriptional regulator [Pseudonocardia saturnea]
MQITAGELVVLGLLAEQPRHGYDVEQVIEQRGIRRWTDIGFSSIYYLLAKLEKRDLVAVEAGTRPSAKSRRVFGITEEGRRTAADGVRELLADAHTDPRSFLAGLANQVLLPPDEVDEALRGRLAALDARIESVVSTREAQHPLPRHALELFSYSLSQLRAERSWLAERVQVSDE